MRTEGIERVLSLPCCFSLPTPVDSEPEPVSFRGKLASVSSAATACMRVTFWLPHSILYINTFLCSFHFPRIGWHLSLTWWFWPNSVAHYYEFVHFVLFATRFNGGLQRNRRWICMHTAAVLNLKLSSVLKQNLNNLWLLRLFSKGCLQSLILYKQQFIGSIFLKNDNFLPQEFWCGMFKQYLFFKFALSYQPFHCSK